jgi:glutaredoxin domain-containing cysteine-rich protein 1
MGCASSKDVAVVADVAYRPPAASVSLFDVSAVEEPWLIAKKNAAANGDHVEAEHSDEESESEEDESEEEEETQEAKKPTTGVALPILDKLDGYELAPASWSEVSKALEDIKPTLDSKQTTDPKPPPKKKKKKKTTKKQPAAQPEPAPSQKEQQSSQTPSAAATGEAAKKAPPPATPYVRGSEGSDTKKPLPELTGRRVVKENPFLLRDREAKNADGTAAAPKWRRRDPFEGYPERRPPGASGGGVVLYTTTLRGVRRTFEDCERARAAVETCTEAAGLTVDERDVALHGEYLRELRELLLAEAEEQGAGVLPPPRLFVMGRYLGGAEACAELVDSGKLAEMLRWARARGEACAAKDGRGCEGCGGARFVPCLECGGSCKVVVGGDGSVTSGVVERCGKCNENGLMMCPICH